MFRWFLPVSAVLALNVSVATAAPPAITPPSGNWTGTFVGAHIGYGFGSVDATLSAITGGYHVEGVLVGLQAGRNWQNGSLVYGWIADVSLGGVDGKWTFDPGPPARHLTTDYDWLATLRGRFGHTFADMLVYFTGGVALAGVHSVRSDPAASSHTNMIGYVVGIGIERRGANGWTYVIEYLYRDFGTQNVANYRLDQTLNSITIGANRRY